MIKSLITIYEKSFGFYKLGLVSEKIPNRPYHLYENEKLVFTVIFLINTLMTQIKTKNITIPNCNSSAFSFVKDYITSQFEEDEIGMLDILNFDHLEMKYIINEGHKYITCVLSNIFETMIKLFNIIIPKMTNQQLKSLMNHTHLLPYILFKQKYFNKSDSDFQNLFDLNDFKPLNLCVYEGKIKKEFKFWNNKQERYIPLSDENGIQNLLALFQTLSNTQQISPLSRSKTKSLQKLNV